VTCDVMDKLERRVGENGGLSEVEEREKRLLENAKRRKGIGDVWK